MTRAAEAVNITRSTAYHLREKNEKFAAAWDEAVEMATDRLEEEARRRALDGCEEPVVSMGKMVRDDNGNLLYVRKYSDQLMITLLKAHRPGKFKDRSEVDLGLRDNRTADDARQDMAQKLDRIAGRLTKPT